MRLGPEIRGDERKRLSRDDVLERDVDEGLTARMCRGRSRRSHDHAESDRQDREDRPAGAARMEGTNGSPGVGRASPRVAQPDQGSFVIRSSGYVAGSKLGPNACM